MALSHFHLLRTGHTQPEEPRGRKRSLESGKDSRPVPSIESRPVPSIELVLHTLTHGLFSHGLLNKLQMAGSIHCVKS